MSEIVIYQTPDNQTQIDVQFEGETFWLTQEDISQLFERDRTVISKHLRNIFKEGELEEIVVSANFAHTTQHGAIKGKTQEKQVKYYNLDAILSVGYRVNSKRGTQFRQWASQRLKDYLVQGYTINEKRLAEKKQHVEYLKTGIRILSRAITQQANTEDSQLLQIFANGLSLLDDYDHEKLDASGRTNRQTVYPDVQDYLKVIAKMKSAYTSDVFAKPKDKGFESSVKQIAQAFGDKDLYHSIEEKAAALLYLIVKNHSFVDGNKRIAAACFLHFLEQNGLLYLENNTPIISNEALAAITLFVATSKPEEMEIVKQLVISILNRSK
ncbi:MAG: virulence protein RhuM/Fic/DOC family protein [Saprospiraceae bacterium]|nr:virulence protein RhuM/Fic/DOC family protein [Candidatus Vicinibacter affinis]MBK7799092.1 virulence protein RhuM/Fic/DOC family protein [Candidatus Vicinibacter affinis]